MDETFLTTEEVLAYLQVNLRTVYRLIKAGKIPAVRVGRQWRFRKRDIDAWLDSQRPRGIRTAAGASATAVCAGAKTVNAVENTSARSVSRGRMFTPPCERSPAPAPRSPSLQPISANIL